MNHHSTPGARSAPFVPSCGGHFSAWTFLLLFLALWPGGVWAAQEGMDKVLGLDLAKGVKELPRGDSKRAAEDPSLRLELKKTAPMAGTIRVGGAVSFEAKLITDKGPIPPGDFVFRWECDGKAKFLEAEGPPLNTVIFLMPGRWKVTAAAFIDKEGVLEQAALSNPVDVEVANPQFQLVVSPQKPLIGEEVKAEVRDFPLHEGVEFRWAPLSRNAKLIRVGEKDVSFFLKDSEPVNVAVSASMPQAGVTLGGASATAQARPYAVELKNLGVLGEKAVVWADGQGPVRTDEVAVGQKVRLRADASPTPDSPPLSYVWIPGPGVTVEGEGRETTVFRRDVGECKVEARIQDSRGLVIGRGEIAFPVSVSQAELDKAGHNARETLRLAAEAEKYWSLGQADKALKSAGAARSLNPNQPEAVRVFERIRDGAARLSAIMRRGADALGADDFRGVSEALDEAGKVNGQYPGIGELEARMKARQDALAKVDALLSEAGKKWDAGDIDAALALVDKALALDGAHPQALADRERMVKGRDRIIAALKEASALAAKKQFESAGAVLEEAAGVNEKFPPLAELRSRIDGQRSKAWKVDELLARAKDQWNGGQVDEAMAALSEILAMEPGHAAADGTLKHMAKAREAMRFAVDKAEALAAKGQEDAALDMIAKALSLNPKYYPAVKADQEIRDSQKRTRRVAALSAESGERWAAGDVDGAVRALDEALALDPGSQTLADRRAKLGRAAEAVSEALRRAKGLMADRLFDKALAALSEAEAINAANPAIAALRASVRQEAARETAKSGELLAAAKKRLDAGDWQGALDAAEEVRMRPGLSKELAAKAGTYAEAARAGLEKAKRAEQAQAKKAQKDQSRGEAKLRRKDCDALFQSAEKKRAAANHAEAIRDYQKTLKVCPDYCTAYNNTGASLYKLGYVKEALPWFEEAGKCDPTDKLFADNIALTKKLASGEAAPKTDPDRERCDASFKLAEKAMASGDHGEAVRHFREAAKLCPDNCAAFNNVGLALNRLGYVKESLPWFERAQICDPTDKLFKENLGIANKQLRAAKKDVPANKPSAARD